MEKGGRLVTGRRGSTLSHFGSLEPAAQNSCVVGLAHSPLETVWLRPRNVTFIGAAYIFEALMKPFEAVLRPA